MTDEPGVTITPTMADTLVPVEGSKRQFWTHILPVGGVTHPGTGKPVVFDDAYHRDVIAGMTAVHGDTGAPIVEVDEKNQHNWRVDNYRGRVAKLAVAGEDGAPNDKPGLWGLVEAADRKTARAMRQNPNLKVSATIANDWREADGRTAKQAFLQLATTLFPRVGGLGGFRPVNLSAEAGPILDLSDATFTEETPVGKKLDDLDLSADISEDEISAALDEAATEGEFMDLSGDVPDETLTEAPEVAARRSSVLELAAVTDMQNRLRVMEAKTATAEWELEREKLTRRGVPKPALDLAAEVLSLPGASVLNLSAASGPVGVDARKTIAGLLELFATTEGHHLNLSSHAEGSGFGDDASDVEYDSAAWINEPING